MSVFHYDRTPQPVGVATNMNGSDKSYMLGIYDGADRSEQYVDDPDAGVLFQSPEGAKAWLEAATAVLTPYIESGDRTDRVPNPEGWSV